MNSSKYIAGIDGLRAIAVLSVLVFHAGFEYFSGGYVGVDVFFVISGYLITGLILSQIRTTGSFSFRDFYARRVRRLFPALFATMTLTFFFAALLFTPQHFQRLGGEIISSILSVSNYFFWSESGYFDTASEFKPLLHTWSLSVEEQFYLLWPLILVFLSQKKNKKALWIAIAVGGLLSFGINILFTNEFISSSALWQSITDGKKVDSASLIYFFTPFRIFEFAIGAALVLIPKPSSNGIRLDVLFSIGLALILYAVFSYTEATLFPSYNALAPCVGAALIIYSIDAKYLGWIVRNRLMVKIGVISYSLYLVHWPIIVFYKYYTQSPLDFSDKVAIIFLSVVIGFFSQKYIEAPFRINTKFRAAKRITFLPACGALSLSLIVLACTALLGNGWKWRIDELPSGVAEQLSNSKQFHIDQYGGADYPYTGWISGGKSGVADIVIIGDSHARHYATGFDLEIGKPLGKNIYISHFGCLVLPGMSKIVKDENYEQGCQKALTDAMNIINVSPNAIIVVGERWEEQLIFAAEKGSKENLPGGNGIQSYIFITKKIAELKTNIGTRQLVIIGSVPGAGNPDVSGCFSRPKLFNSNCERRLGIMEAATTTTPGNKILEDFARSNAGITFLNPYAAFCNDGFCRSYGNEKVYYSDEFHLSKAGSIAAIRFFKSDFLHLLRSDDNNLSQ